jgi:hypothetical protein
VTRCAIKQNPKTPRRGTQEQPHHQLVHWCAHTDKPAASRSVPPRVFDGSVEHSAGATGARTAVKGGPDLVSFCRRLDPSTCRSLVFVSMRVVFGPISQKTDFVLRVCGGRARAGQFPKHPRQKPQRKQDRNPNVSFHFYDGCVKVECQRTAAHASDGAVWKHC